MSWSNQVPEQKSSDFLKSHSDIPREALWFLDKIGKIDWDKQADLFRKNEKIVSGMETILSSKVEAIISKWDQIDDNDAKMLIVYDALKNRYLTRTIPNNSEERKILALNIAENITLVQWFDAHTDTDTDRYYDFINKYYTSFPSENTFDLNTDAISFDAWNAAINSFLSKNNGLQNWLLYDKKRSYLYNITRYTDKDSLLHKQVNAKMESRYRDSNIRDQRLDFKNNPDKCMELTDLFLDNKEAFNNPQNEDMVALKKFFVSILTDSYPNEKSSAWLYRWWEDLSRDNWFEWGWDGENIKKNPAKLENNNIQIVVDGNNISIVNNITKTSLALSKDTFDKWIVNREKKERNNKAVEEYRNSFEKKYMQDHNLTQDDINDISEDDRFVLYKDFQNEMFIDIFTSNKDAFDAILDQQEFRQNWPDQMHGSGYLFNSVIEKINGWPILWFDCNMWNTTMEIKESNWQKYFEIIQGISVVQIGFNKILSKKIDQRTPEEKQKEEEEKQEELAASSDINIDDYKPENRIPDLRRAICAIENTREYNGIRHIDLNNLNLTDEDVNLLSKKIIITGRNYALDLSNNIINHVPKSIFNIQGIGSINLSNNRLVSLPNINWANHLTSLHIAANNFNYLPDLKQFTNLESIDISSNNIPNIDKIEQIDNLTNFTADKIWVSSIPMGLMKKHSLKKLSLSNNNLTDKLDISQLPNLEHLYIDGNKNMKEFPTTGINRTIKTIDCRHTDIKTIPTNIKQDCPTIKDIHIYSNILSGKQMINQFLIGDLTNKWYMFNKNWVKTNINEVKDFFLENKKFTYTEHTADSIPDWLEKAKKSLWLTQLDNIPYAVKKLPSWKTNVTVFSPVQEINNRSTS